MRMADGCFKEISESGRKFQLGNLRGRMAVSVT